MSTVTVSQARAALPELLDRVDGGEEVTITRHGRPVAVMLRPAALRARRADEAFATVERTRAAIADGRRRALTPSTGISADRADELVSALRAERDKRS